MRDRPWDRAEVVKAVADRIWLTLASDSEHLPTVMPQAAAVLQLPRTDVAFLKAFHLALAPEAGSLLETTPQLLRSLRTSTVAELETHPERLRGPVAWGETLALWSRTGSRSTFSTLPVRRDFETPETRLLAGALRALSRAIAETSSLAGTTGAGSVLASRALSVRHALATPVMRELSQQQPLTDLRRVERGRSFTKYEPVIAFWRLADRLNRLEDRGLLREMVERAALVTVNNGALMECLALFHTWQVLEGFGWTSGSPRLGPVLRIS